MQCKDKRIDEKLLYIVIIEVFIDFQITCSPHEVMPRGTKCALFPYIIVKNWTVIDKVGFDPRVRSD